MKKLFVTSLFVAGILSPISMQAMLPRTAAQGVKLLRPTQAAMTPTTARLLLGAYTASVFGIVFGIPTVVALANNDTSTKPSIQGDVDAWAKKILFEAVSKDDGAFITQLQKTGGVNFDSKDENGNTALIYGLKARKPGALKALLATNADKNIYGSNGETLLHSASMGKTTLDTFESLLKGKTDLDARTAWGEAALHLAIGMKYPERAIKLLEAGANPNIKNRHNETPLHIATNTGDLQSVTALLKTGIVDIDAQDEYGNTALHKAAYGANTNLFLFSNLLNAGANPNIKNNHGATPLILAANGNNFGIINYMLQNCTRLDINAQDKLGDTALHLVAERSNLPAVQILLEAGADATIKRRIPGWNSLAEERTTNDTISNLIKTHREHQLQQKMEQENQGQVQEEKRQIQPIRKRDRIRGWFGL